MRTSISDLPNYREACRRAAGDEAAFAGFRRDPDYSWVVSEAIPHEARDFYEMLERRGFDFDFFERVRDLDQVGGPHLVAYARAGSVSPQTMRYVKVLSDLETLFGSLDGKSIVEIGVGFGGQCAVLARRHRLARYTLVDLPEPLMVARRYLESLAIDNVAFAVLEELSPPVRHDLVISTYGLSEVARRFQVEYVNRVLRWAGAGYLLWNSEQMKQVRDWHSHLYGSDAIYVDEMLALLPEARCLGPEWLAVGEREYGTRLMVWGTR
ncbi:MAG: class I SAM-dependent methyltransferase [Proteobacteria bacterium]|nr:class I SAM-dependent methyltransferase [Pseudomonadota bacterium]